jgi:hypothetical protein
MSLRAKRGNLNPKSAIAQRPAPSFRIRNAPPYPLALAIELGATVVTADERWANALQNSPCTRFITLLASRRP